MTDPVAVLIDLINRHDEFRVFARPIIIDVLDRASIKYGADEGSGHIADAILDALESGAAADAREV